MEKQKEKREKDQAEKTRIRELEKDNSQVAPVAKMVGGSKHGARVSPMSNEDGQGASV